MDAARAANALRNSSSLRDVGRSIEGARSAGGTSEKSASLSGTPIVANMLIRSDSVSGVYVTPPYSSSESIRWS